MALFYQSVESISFFAARAAIRLLRDKNRSILLFLDGKGRRAAESGPLSYMFLGGVSVTDNYTE